MPANIFINYRKDDSRWNTHALYTGLLKYFPDTSLFKDFNTIRPGEIYRDVITAALAQCDVLLVVIGRNWLHAKNKDGLLRLQSPDDLVRLEITTALKRGIKVIPVLFDNIDMFAVADLPEDLQPLTQRQSVSMSDSRFDADLEILAAAIKKILDKKKQLPQTEHKTLEKDDDTGTDNSHEFSAQLVVKKGRWNYALITAAIAGVFSGIAIAVVLFNTKSYQSTTNSDSVSYEAIRYGFIAGLLWLIPGAIATDKKLLIRTAVVCSFIMLAAWIIAVEIIWGAGSDPGVITAAIMLGMPAGAALGIPINWRKQKRKEYSDDRNFIRSGF